MKTVKQLLSIIISYSLVVLPLNAADIQVDGSTHTTLDAAQNGVPIVNIANPNSSGLSHNKFTNYNVTNQGVILNNSGSVVNTQLGGYVLGNKNLTSNAKVILNEVTSTSRTTLGGYTEVAGKKADLVIANPNGITINGAGFINTSNVTLTTGSPVINNGQLSSFNIQGGDISIQGDGLDVSEQDSAHLYSYYLTLNAAIYAKDLDIKLGQNNIDYTTNEITSHTDVGTATLLLDSSALGGMYAQRITLIGTDKGIGVNLPSEVLASNGDISITNDGTIELQKLTAKGDISVNSNDSNTHVNDTISSGNDLSLKANTLTNDGLINASHNLTVFSNNFINNETAFSGNNMYLYTTNTLINNENSNILAVNNLTMSADNTNARTQIIENKSATIQTLNGDINLYAGTFNNIATILPTKSSTTTLVSQYNYNIGGITSFNSFSRTVTLTEESLDTTGYIPSYFLSGKNLHIDAKTLNQYSTISASGNIELYGSLDNQANLEAYKILATDTRYECITGAHGNYLNGCVPIWHFTGKIITSYSTNLDTYNATYTLLDSAHSVIQAGGSITGNVNLLSNGNVNSSQAISSSSNTVANNLGTQNQDLQNLDSLQDANGLFVINRTPSSNYLIETNPAFTIYNNFISSDYLLSHIDYDAESTTKRLGDAFYENTLIRDSIFEQTGQRFLNSDIKNDNDQYKYLMDNAIKASSDLKLTPGIALSKEQINALTDDIVWMEEKVVQGEKVLVPVVYIANPNKFKLQGARIIAADDINLQTANLKNAGTITAGNDLTVKASDSISNYGGNLNANQDINLESVNDITNTSGTIKADNINLTSTNGDIKNERYTQAATVRDYKYLEHKTLLGKAGDITAANNLNIDAKEDMIVSGSDLNAKTLNIDAKNLIVTTTKNKRDSFKGTSGEYHKESSLTNIASNLSADDININTQDTTTIKGSNLKANGNININTDKLDILAVNNTHYTEDHSSSSGFFSSSSTTTKKMTSTNIASTLDASNINLSTNTDDINIAGSKLHAQDTLSLNSADDINIQAGYDGTMNEVHKQSSGFFSGGNLYSQSEDLDGKLTKTAVNSDLSANNIELNSKNDLTTVGADLQADESLNASASDISVQNATNEEQTYSKHTKLSIGVGEMAKSIMLPTENLNYDNGKVSIMLAKGMYDKNTKVTTKTTVAASNIDAKNITLNAASEDQDSGNILVKGSNLAAQENINLTASNNVDIQEAKETTTTDSSSTHGEAKINFTVKNEFVQIGYVIDDATKAAEALKKTQSDYEKYKKDLASQEEKLSQLKTDLKNNKLGIEQSDVDEMQKYVDDLKDDDAYYKANIALATTTLSTKLAAVAAQGGKTVSSAGSAGFNAGFELDIDAIEKKLQEYKEKSVASNLSADNINITANNKATVQGSNLQAANDININAKNTDILASTDISNTDTSSNHQNINVSYEMYGGTNSNVSEDGSKSSSTQVTHTNSTLLANNININTAEDTNIKGATVQADDTLTLNTKNLNVSSVQDTTSSNSDSQSASMGFSGFTPSSVGGSASHSKSDAKDTLLTSLTANKVDITAQEDTTLKGATIAAVDAYGNDNGGLTLKTDTLHVSSLNNTVNSKSISMGGNIGISVNDPDKSKKNSTDKKESDTTSTSADISFNYANDTTHSKTKTLATIGDGLISLGDSSNSDTRMLNRDIKDNTVDIYDISSHKGLSGELDTRILTSDGWKQIAQDILKSRMIPTSIEAIISSNTIGINNFFKVIDIQNKVYTGIEEKIASDATLAAALTNPYLTPSQKQQMLNSVTGAVMQELGYATYNNKMIDTSLPGKDGQQVKGFASYETNDAYINDRYNSSTTDLLTTAGHEMSHLIDLKAGVGTDEAYADILGSSFANYTDFALYYTDQGSLATTNTHNTGQVTSTPSVFNDNTYATNNAEFSSLDKSKGDNFLWLIPLAVVAFETYSNTPESSSDTKTGPTEMINLMPGYGIVKAPVVAKGFFGKISEKLFKGGEKETNIIKYGNEAKIKAQMKQRGWTEEEIQEAMQTKGIPATGKNGEAVRYVHPTTGKSVVVDKQTNEVFHVGGEGFKY